MAGTVSPIARLAADLKAIERAGGTRIDTPAEIGKVVPSTLKK